VDGVLYFKKIKAKSIKGNDIVSFLPFIFILVLFWYYYFFFLLILFLT